MTTRRHRETSDESGLHTPTRSLFSLTGGACGARQDRRGEGCQDGFLRGWHGNKYRGRRERGTILGLGVGVVGKGGGRWFVALSMLWCTRWQRNRSCFRDHEP